VAFLLLYQGPSALHLINHGLHYFQGWEKQSFPWWEREFVWNEGLKLELRICTDLRKLGGRTEFDLRTESNWLGRLPIRTLTVSGRTGVFPVELGS